ncbi:unnamed protein product [Didymodactylos carnosus]|uniref:EGF-like domain-containing protein n=1 Tax=Didymodactylos carnosus TaxID=1234261 RepID=A0A813R1H8_9BILA|nr:unnamed protein product [Didymodactylos carnosus]CAF0814244.1 unnamed protein product [Didymodactylos carnosus]CAF3558695.1 unnamed protein product [Didymodactylos carnosus]CAF3598187.1 unnamed protein product [Didymodactylos carnosus]
MSTITASTKNCTLHYDRYKTLYSYSLTYHCQQVRSFPLSLSISEIVEKKLPLKISKSSHLSIESYSCENILWVIIESSQIEKIDKYAFSCKQLRLLSITDTNFTQPDQISDNIFHNAIQLQTIRLCRTNLKRLPMSIESLTNLTELILDDMYSLLSYPSIEKLTKLRYFHVFTNLNYFPLKYVEYLNNLHHIQIFHFGSRTIETFPKELFHLNGYQLTDISLYSENIQCSTCKTDWLKTIVKTLMLNGWYNRTRGLFPNKKFHLGTSQYYKLDILAYCGDMRTSGVVDDKLMLHNAPLCCNKGYYQCGIKANCTKYTSTFYRCKCLDGYYADSYDDCVEN